MSIHSEHEEISIGPNISVETNWSPDSTPCRLFRFKVDGKEAVVGRAELFGMLFMFGDEKQQEDLIPVVETKVRSITRLLSFTLKKDMRKGERVRAQYQYFVPESVAERLLLSDPERYKPGTISTDELEKHVNKIV